MKSVGYVLLGSMLIAGNAIAGEMDFDEHDKNGDGTLSESEWSEVEQANADFHTVDANGDGALDRSEVNNATQESMDISTDGQQGTSEAQTVALDDDASDQGEIRRTGQFIEEDQDRAQQEQQQVLERQDSDETPVTTTRVGFDASAEGREAFEQADSDQDGRISESEARLAGYEYVAIYFNDLDVDQDGYLREEEWDLSQRAGMEDQGASSRDVSAEDEAAAYQDEDMAAPDVEQITQQDEAAQDDREQQVDNRREDVQYQDVTLENEEQEQDEEEDRNRNGSEQ